MSIQIPFSDLRVATWPCLAEGHIFLVRHTVLWLTCVPRVIAGGPGQVPGEGVGQIEDGPGQHNNVVDVKQGSDHLGGITHS